MGWSRFVFLSGLAFWMSATILSAAENSELKVEPASVYLLEIEPTGKTVQSEKPIRGKWVWPSSSEVPQLEMPLNEEMKMIPLVELAQPIQLPDSQSNFLIKVDKWGSAQFTDPKCEALKLEISNLTSSSQLLAAKSWVRCFEKDDKIEVRVFTPSKPLDANEGVTTVPGVRWNLVHPTLVVFEVGKDFNLSRAPSPWSWGLSSQLSELIYNEPTQNLSISQLAMTGKADVRFSPPKHRWDLGAYGFVTLFPLLSQAPAGIQTPRFYGAGARLGLPLDRSDQDPTKFRKTLSIGPYFWGMLLSNQTYGISGLAGPQFVFSLGSPPASGKVWSVYGKYALIFDAISVPQFGNIEVATGGLYRLKKFDLTLDCAYATAKSSGVRASKMTLFSSTFGLRFRL